jgi:rSAM/selenodomain-associated transferase 1
VTPKAALVLFAKRPEPGRVKTRLARGVGDRVAANLAEAFLRDASRAYAGLPEAAPVVAADPDPGDPYWRDLFPEPWRIEPQGGGDLGGRLARGLARELRTHSHAAAIGADHPALPIGLLSRFLREDNAVWPARDGGYAAILISRSAADAGLFDGIAWSTDRVLAQTIERADGAGIELALYPETSDIDVAEDLDDLFEELRRRDPAEAGFPIHSWEALRSWKAGPEGSAP